MFDGRFGRDMRAGLDDVRKGVADYTEGQIQARLGQVLQHPTGHYQSTIHVLHQNLQEMVTDGGIIYGPWLEGVSKRNAATRFKGYFTFRRVTQAVQTKVNEIAQKALSRRIGGDR